MRSSSVRRPIHRLLSLLVASSFLSIALAGDALAVPEVNFPDGVAAGDVTAQSAVLWTRVDRDLPVKIEVSTNAAFAGPEVFKQTVHPSAGNDLTVKALAAPLAPGTRHYYRWRHGSAVSEVGTFVTAPAADAAANVRLAYTADSDGFFGSAFAVLDAVRAESPDFWVYLGDTIYSDSSLRPGGPAMTLDEYRDNYRLNRSIEALPELMSKVSTVPIWDDHEVQNDYAGQTVDPTRYANGRKAFIEYMPFLEMNLPEDPTCAGDPLFRSFHWGSEVDVFVLDERSCRSAQATPACVTAVIGSSVFVDVAPTLPDPVRGLFRAQLIGAGVPAAAVNLVLPAVPSPVCLAAVQAGTMLGPVQKAAFKAALLASTAKWKIVVNEVPIQQFWALPYDRWEGYQGERAEILNFIRSNGIQNVIFATTDMHANVINGVRIDTFVDPQAIAREYITGPIATNTFESEVFDFGENLLPGAGALFVGAFQQLLNISGASCRNLNVDSYALVEVDAAAGTASISLKDENGVVVSDQLNPALQCAETLGP